VIAQSERDAIKIDNVFPILRRSRFRLLCADSEVIARTVPI